MKVKGLCYLLGLLVISSITYPSSCNQMNPHLFPHHGAYFEGWYLRVIDFTQGTSVGWIFNRIRPENSAKSTGVHDAKCKGSSSSSCHTNQTMTGNYPHPIMITHLVSSNHNSKLLESHVLLPADGYTLTKNGQPIESNPEDKTPAEFEAKMGEHISFIVRPNGTRFTIRVGDDVFKGETDSPVAWGPHGKGPEGWLGHLHLPIHWFVYSLRSEVKYYEYANNKTGQVIRGGSRVGKPVVAHMEKNWGGSFPKAWIWAEGVNPENNASFASSSGILHEIFNVKAELSGYRNPSKKISCSFHPLNSVHVLEHDGCKGNAKLKAESLECLVIFDISADPNSLSACLITPQVKGYKLGCVETYNAVANITVFERKGFEMVHVDSQIITMAALEFGGAFMCNGKCPA